MEKGESRLGSQNHCYKKEIKEAINRLIMAKTTDIDETPRELLMHGGKVELNMMYVMYQLAWEVCKVSGD